MYNIIKFIIILIGQYTGYKLAMFILCKIYSKKCKYDCKYCKMWSCTHETNCSYKSLLFNDYSRICGKNKHNLQ